MLWYEHEKVDRKVENIYSFQNILTWSGGVAKLGQNLQISFSNGLCESLKS